MVIVLDKPHAELTQAVDQLEPRLQRQLKGRVRDFRLQVRGNGLVLKGRCRTYYSKQLAQHLVMREIDLPIVANEIEVA